ncbi:MAG: sodium:proton antiporter NhaD [Nitrospirae bacterium]|nr:sodium:proton antiporter NhaD [Nitrospirota bacterium]
MANASEIVNGERIDLTNNWIGYVSIIVFIISYIVVMTEEFTCCKKSKPVIFAAGIIWAMIAYAYAIHGQSHIAQEAIKGNILEYSELFLFLFVAMTYVNAMAERNVFIALRIWLTNKGYGYRKLFWIIAILSFFLSSQCDNLTTAIIMCAIVLAVGKANPKFINLSCIVIVVAANAGGAFCPFGDITTLMVWQKGLVGFFEFFKLFIPSLINLLVPAAIMHFAVPKELPQSTTNVIPMKRGARRIIFLFALTIITSVCFRQFLGLPPVAGMMLGLSYLQFMGYYLKKTYVLTNNKNLPFDIFDIISRAEWDTLLFFYGVILCVGGLGFIGYLDVISRAVYIHMGTTFANIFIGIISAVIDNIPVMYGVLTMHPVMPLGQWLLVTMTVGVGGSLLSIGSAAGIALMGVSEGRYTFFSHLKWTPVIALGYILSIYVHFLINSSSFN